jgi:methyltransferase (TIGR00027 family)
MKAFKHISDTAFLVAAYRAMESERPDFLFKDPHARQLVGQHGPDLVAQLKDGHNSSWFLVARTLILDEWIKELIAKENIKIVLNLAAGLDTRAFRLELPTNLNWYDIDLPEITQYKEKIVKTVTPICKHHFISLDLAQREQRNQFFDSVAKPSQKALIISEGFLMYLNPQQAAELAKDLGKYSSFRFWLAELIGPVQLKLIQLKWGKAFKEANSEMQFAPGNGAAFFNPYGWATRDFKSSLDKAIEIQRAPSGAILLRTLFSLFPRAISKGINTAGIALLENISPAQVELS